jgi:hypothetical protein
MSATDKLRFRGEVMVIFRKMLKWVRNIHQPVLHSKVKNPPRLLPGGER